MSTSPSNAIQVALEEDSAGPVRANRLRWYNTVQIPALRLMGSVLLALVVWLYQRYVPDTPEISWVGPFFVGYALVSWPILRLFYGRTGRLDLGLLFLLLDIPVWTLAIYATGSERSWLFMVLLLRVVDQTHSSFKTALLFGHLVTASYAALLLYADVFAHHGLSWPDALVKLLFLYASCLYAASVARAADRNKRKMADTLRITRELVTQVQEKTTQLEASQAHLLQAKDAAESANVAKSQFLATMSHELRTPLNGILGMTQLILMSDMKKEEVRDSARTILQSGQGLLAILNDILDMSKIEAGKIELENIPFSPAALADEVAHLFAENARSKGVTIESVWHFPDHDYRSDPIRLRQMLTNLVGNAVKFTEHGTIRIGGEEVENDGDTAMLEFSVADEGVGIAADKQALLFRPFSQIDASSTRKFGGTGLGLSIVSRLARLMGGDVGVKSEEGRGSHFWFRVRVQLVRPEEDHRRMERDEVIHVSPPPQAADAVQVLLVEDTVINQKVIGGMLTKLGLSYTLAENGQAALDILVADASPSIVLMDCQMPVMNGYDATAKIRALEAKTGRPHLPVIALTAGAYQEDRDKCFAAGMDDYLSKPVDFAVLSATLNKWIEGNRG